MKEKTKIAIQNRQQEISDSLTAPTTPQRERLAKLRKAAEPLIKLLNEEYHPHHTCIVTSTSIELLEGVASDPKIYDFIVDQPQSHEKETESVSMGFFNDYARSNDKMHPIAKAFYDAMQECEQLPASEQQTKTVIAINDCRSLIEQMFEKQGQCILDCINDAFADTNGKIDSLTLASLILKRLSYMTTTQTPKP